MRIFKRVIAVFIVVLTAFLLVPKGKAANAVKPYGDKTNTFKYDDVNQFENYTSTLDKLESYTQDYSAPAKGIDKEIEKIIPLNCFVQKGTHIHIGIKYGFYVYTSRDGSDYKNECEVFIFKVERTMNTNPGYTPSKAGNLVYGIFTQYRPVLSNDYTYKCEKNLSSYEIRSKHSTNEVAINYAFNISLSKEIEKYHNKLNWATAHGTFPNPAKDEILLDTCSSAITMVIDVMYTILQYYVKGDIPSAFIDMGQIAFQALFDSFVDYKLGKLNLKEVCLRVTNRMLEIATKTLTSKLGSKFNSIAALFSDMFVNIFVLIYDSVEDGSFNLSDLVDTVISCAKSKLKSDNYDLIDFDVEIKEKVDDASDSLDDFAEILSTALNIKDCISDFFETATELYFYIKEPSYMTTSETKFGLCSIGSSGSKYMRIRAEKQNRVSTYNVFEFNPNTISKNNYVEVRSEIQFRNGSNDNCKSIVSTYKMKLYDSNSQNLYIDGPTYANSTYTYYNVAISDGTDYRYVYVNPKIDGSYTFSATTDNGQVCTCSSSKLSNGIYRISIYTGNLKGNHYISLSVKVISNIKNLSTSFTCSKPGTYLITINNNYSDVYFEVTSVSYSQVYNFSSYSYTRTTYVTPNKVSNKQYKVTLESGKTYSISYKCNYNSSVSIVYTL